MPEQTVTKKMEPSSKAQTKSPQPTITTVEYSTEEIGYRDFLIRRFIRARDEREYAHTELDDLSYSEAYDQNAKAANAYNPPKANKEDTRIVTGVTQEKTGTLLDAILNYNLEPSVAAYDENDMKMYEIGELMEDMLKKSRRLEDYDVKRPLYYKELFDQGSVFIEEVKVENIIPEKTFNNTDWMQEGVNIDRISWKTKFIKQQAQCETRMIPGINVYPGNMKEFFLSKWPFMFTVENIPYDVAKTEYNSWDRWEHVPRQLVHWEPTENDNVGYSDWTLYEVQQDMVERIKYYDPIDNEYMVILNGVMMLPIRFPLTFVSPSGMFPIAKGDAEPISQFFAISKSIPAKMRVDQKAFDETFRALLLKLRRSLEPPMANNTNRVLSRKIFYPGRITPGINPNDLAPILPADGISQAEFNVFQLQKDIMNEKSVSPSFQGLTEKGDMTATQVNRMQQQQLLRLGMPIIGVINLERQLAQLRLHNILSTWTEPIDSRINEARETVEEVYRKFSIDTTFEDGTSGTRVVAFTPDALDISSEQVKAMEDRDSRPGMKIRYTFIDPNALRTLKANWFIDVAPTEKDSGDLDRVMYKENLLGAYELFGPQSVNTEYAKERWAIVNKEDPNKFFAQQEAQPTQPGAEEAPGVEPPPGATGLSGGPVSANIAKQVTSTQENAPGLNSLIQG